MDDHGIAIVGMACRFPGCESVQGFWQMLLNAEVATETPWRTDEFDAAFFGISAREAMRMDPQQRMLLELSWEAMEDAGLRADQLQASRTGVFAGVSGFDYTRVQYDPSAHDDIDGYTNTGASLSIVSNRISHTFDLRGPSMTIDAACSSSLLAVHQACRAMAVGDCDMAFAAGVNVILWPEPQIGFERMGVMAKDGRCKTFSEEADGFVRAEGAGVVLLKPLEKADADNDRIYAVISGSATNQDGHTATLTTPSESAQAELIRLSCQDAGVDPARIDYVEAHGTGTAVGDPIEVLALSRAIASERESALTVGSVKTNIGHLEAGAGIAGLIKASLAVHNSTIPATVLAGELNPEIDFDRLNVRVAAESQPWEATRRFAGVSSFGFGGSNVHVVLRNHGHPQETAKGGTGPYVLPLSARSPEALQALAERWSSDVPSVNPALANAAIRRRSALPVRAAIVASSIDDLREQLKQIQPSSVLRDPKIAFVCSGQGPQWYGMGRELMQDPVFAKTIAECDAAFKKYADWSLVEELNRPEGDTRIHETEITQPALFAVQYGLFKLLEKQGISSEIVLGHSVGEVAAACISGALSFEDACELIVRRGTAMAGTRPGGGMLTVFASREEVTELIQELPGLVIAAENSSQSFTVSGPTDTIDRLITMCADQQVFARKLKVDRAFHSDAMESAKGIFEALFFLTGETEKTFVSTVTGEATSDLDASYWWRNVREPVQFRRAVEVALKAGASVFVELGPHPVLSEFVRQTAREQKKDVRICSLQRRKEDGYRSFLAGLGQLFCAGVELNWDELCPETASWRRLPNYPWQHQHHWLESEACRLSRSTKKVHPLLGRRITGIRPSWEVDLGDPELTWLEGHRLQGDAVFPAAGYIEMMLAVAEQVLESPGCVLENVQFRRMLHGRDNRLRTIYNRQRREIEIVSRQGESWSTIAVGKLYEGTDQVSRLPGFTGGKAYDVSTFYEKLELAGYDYQGQFRALRELRRAANQVAATIDPVEAAAVLDAAFQSLLLLKPDNSLQVPVRIDRLVCTGSQESNVIATAVSPNTFDLRLGSTLSIQGLHTQVVDSGQPAEPGVLRQEWKEIEIPTESRKLLCIGHTPVQGEFSVFTADTVQACEGIIYAAEGNDSEGCVLNLLHLCQQIQNIGSPKPLTVITRGNICQHSLAVSQPRLEGEAPDEPQPGCSRRPWDLAHTTIPGFIRSLRWEWGVPCQVIDLPDNPSEVDIKLLDRAVHQNRGEEIAIRNGQAYGLRLTPGVNSASLHDATNWQLTPKGPVACPPPQVSGSRAIVELDYVGLNFSDVLKSIGLYPGFDGPPSKPGIEAVGRVIDSSDSRFGPDTRVIVVGATDFQRRLEVSPSQLTPIPSGFDPSRIAGLPIAFLTSHYALVQLADIAKAQRVLIHSASGGVGLAAIQIAQGAGATIFATAGNEKKRDFLRSLGVEYVFNSRDTSFVDSIRAITDGVDIVLNTLSGAGRQASLDLLAPFGSFLEIGKRDIYDSQDLDLYPFRKNISFHSIDLEVLLKQKPELIQQMLDEMLTQLADGRLKPLHTTVIPADGMPDAIDRMKRSEHIGKLVVDLQSLSEVPMVTRNTLQVREDATYLITGGTRGLGLATAVWLAENGAGSLVLCSRSGKADDEATLERIVGCGCHVEVRKVDVSDPDQMAQLFAQIDADLPELRGVIHAAMVIDDGLITEQTDQRYRAVLSPKVSGAMHLHELTRERELDFFILYSSIAAILGNPGQSSYTAANSFLDGLAALRRQMNLPATSIAWTHISDKGFVARNPKIRKQLNQFLGRGLTATEALALGSGFFGSDTPYWAIGRLNAGGLTRLHSGNSIPPALQQICSVVEGGDDLAQLLLAAEAEREGLLIRALREQVAAILHSSVDQIPDDQPITEFGIDSLMAIELKTWLDGELQIQTSMVELMRGPTLREVAVEALKRFDGS